jgi:DnaJ like chaperone protein
MGGKVKLSADEVGHLVALECHYEWRVGNLYVTSKKVWFEYEGGWANWPLEYVKSCKLGGLGLVLELSDRHNAPQLWTGNPGCDKFVVSLIQKLISMRGPEKVAEDQSDSGQRDAQSAIPLISDYLKSLYPDTTFRVYWQDGNVVHVAWEAGPETEYVRSHLLFSRNSHQIPDVDLNFHHTDRQEPPRQSRSRDEHRTKSGPQPKAVSPKSAYEILDVSPGATPDEITKAYHREAQKNHPDKVATMAPEFRELAEKRMKELNAAYEELSNRVK